MLKILTVSVLGLSLLGACSSTEPTNKIEISRVVVDKPKPIVPEVPTYRAREVKWVAVTPENVNEILAQNKVLYAVDANGYRSILMNMTDLQTVIQKQKVVIKVYEES